MNTSVRAPYQCIRPRSLRSALYMSLHNNNNNNNNNNSSSSSSSSSSSNRIGVAKILSGVHFFLKKSWRPFLLVALRRRSKTTKSTTPTSKSPKMSWKLTLALPGGVGVHLVCWGAITNFPCKLRLKNFVSPTWGFRCTHCTPWLCLWVTATTTITEDTRGTAFLFPRLSMALQRGNVVSFQNTMFTEWSAVVAIYICLTSVFTPTWLCAGEPKIVIIITSIVITIDDDPCHVTTDVISNLCSWEVLFCYNFYVLIFKNFTITNVTPRIRFQILTEYLISYKFKLRVIQL